MARAIGELKGEMWDLFVGAVEDSGNRRTIFDVTTGSQHDDAWLDARVSGSERSSSAALRSYLESWTRGSDIHERVEGNPTPVLAVAGANDPAMGPEARNPPHPTAEHRRNPAPITPFRADHQLCTSASLQVPILRENPSSEPHFTASADPEMITGLPGRHIADPVITRGLVPLRDPGAAGEE
ncbi:hypothetical protein [Streptomyces sp. NBC_00572]|uniref:hypothetical protein n=1 Tax=Streptomyces sp. NBC_00572 TaxID=2903664 RepID=UPI00224D19DC|nr:hypothetical protein [Streptomyces sp. NBC_00572]MCX4987035.1 hypothetical protein [Streptomyces sp. NBC_00572]